MFLHWSASGFLYFVSPRTWSREVRVLKSVDGRLEDGALLGHLYDLDLVVTRGRDEHLLSERVLGDIVGPWTRGFNRLGLLFLTARSRTIERVEVFLTVKLGRRSVVAGTQGGGDSRLLESEAIALDHNCH